jgi:hypothetical protein
MSLADVLLRLESSLGGWAGFQAPLMLGQPLAPNEPGAPSFPFRTISAEALWQWICKLIPSHPEMSERDIIRLAVEQSGLDPLDFSPEDWRLLEIATEWRKNGTTGIKVPTIGGMPGGPANSTVAGPALTKRGAP